MRIIFFSDAHLTRKNNGSAETVERFLHDVCKNADIVVILGDLFEFYHGYPDHIYPWYRSVVEACRHITREGKSVYFIEGNHELDMGSFFESYTGMKCARSLTIDIEGKKTFIAHGDDIDNKLLARLLRSRFTYGTMDFFGPDLSWKIAMASRIILSRKKKPYDTRVLNLFREYARKKLDEGFDAVILAHSHMSDRFEYSSQGSKKIYLNTGDLIECSTYVEYNSETGFDLKTFASATGSQRGD